MKGLIMATVNVAGHGLAPQPPDSDAGPVTGPRPVGASRPTLAGPDAQTPCADRPMAPAHRFESSPPRRVQRNSPQQMPAQANTISPSQYCSASSAALAADSASGAPRANSSQ